MPRPLALFSALILILFLSACDSAEERAEEHYQNALTLLAEEDYDRAIIELRNVFQLVPDHREARHAIARALLVGKDNPRQAYGQYLRLVEQYPDDVEALIELSDLAFFVANWDELERHGSRAIELDPDNPRVQIIASALDYRTALADEDTSAQAAAVASARRLLEGAPTNRILRELILDSYLRNQEYTSARNLLDELTGEFPETKRYWLQRLQVFIAVGDQDAIEAQLVDLVERFPDDIEQKATLIRYFLSRGDLDKSEAFLRQLVDEAEPGDPAARMDLIRFLMELRSIEQARVEIVDAIETEDDPTPFIILNAALDFSLGNVDIAISDLEAALDGAEPSEQTNQMKVSLSQMLLSTGNEVGARALIEEVLLADPLQSDALKLNAAWLIEADDTDGAIAALRAALDENPEDAAAMSLMADAYFRTGSTDLARDFLSLAVEASGNAPAETVRYANFLIAEDRFLPAEDILLPALRVAPGDLDLLRTTGQLYLGMQDLGRLQQVIDTLRQLETDEANQMAVMFEASRISHSGGDDQALQFIENLATSADADLTTRIMLVRARLAAGDFASGIRLAEELAQENPEAPALRVMLAVTLASSGDLDRAIGIYRDLITEFPNEPSLKVELATNLVRNGQPEEARTVIQQALETNPDDPRLMWANASYLEQDGDIDGAIAVYESMYEMNSGNMIVANNLASLIATYRDDEDSLNRAWTIARRFRDAEVAAIQDTYGWITHRRGNSEEALSYLSDAAAALTSDPIVQFHLAEVLFALNRNEDALAQYRLVLDLANFGDTRAQIEKARDQILLIEAELAASNQ